MAPTNVSLAQTNTLRQSAATAEEEAAAGSKADPLVTNTLWPTFSPVRKEVSRWTEEETRSRSEGSFT